jgi:transcriptional regulator with XRE-family HTH domain
MDFAALIKSERARLGLTQAQAAELLDVPARTLWEWEHGKTVPLAVAQEGVKERFFSAPSAESHWKKKAKAIKIS